MAKFIKLRNFKNSSPVIINIEHIGHFYYIPEEIEYNRVVEAHTRVGVTTHNNGGFDVKESPSEILELINKK